MVETVEMVGALRKVCLKGVFLISIFFCFSLSSASVSEVKDFYFRSFCDFTDFSAQNCFCIRFAVTTTCCLGRPLPIEDNVCFEGKDVGSLAWLPELVRSCFCF